MVPDPAFSTIPLALTNIFIMRNTTGPCGKVEWLAYSLVLNYAGPNGSRWAGRTTNSWSTNPRCCGSGTAVQHACKLAVFKWTDRADGSTDLAIYDPSNTLTPILTVKGILTLPIYIPYGNTSTWHTGPPGTLGNILRFLDQDIATITNGTEIVGHVVDNFDFDTTLASPMLFEGIGGPEAYRLAGTWLPLGGGFAVPTTFRIQYWAI
eukprot:jgi/Botrbrau1/19519/Bobra.0035s0018.2